MRELSLHLLDIVENSIRAGADLIIVRVEESGADDLLTLAVEDNGCGIPEHKAQRVDDPFLTTRTTRRVGLGLSLLAAAARRCGGGLRAERKAEGGTRVTATFQRSHIDRAPLGDEAGTVGVLILGHPHIDFHYTHRLDGSEFVLDTRDLRRELGAPALSDPAVVHHLTGAMRRALAKLVAEAGCAPHREGIDAEADP
jgi:anti-sigma regulatory factor (Ser/Thr protein kinase)